MKPISFRVQLILVAATYAAVLATATVLVLGRYMLYVRHPQDVAAAAGMYAAGDWMLEIIICCMLRQSSAQACEELKNRRRFGFQNGFHD